jgi:hypothetical protein
VQLRYANDDLRRIATDVDHQPRGWSGAERDRFLLVAQCAAAAIGPEDLLAFRRLGLRKLASATAVASLSPTRQITIQFEMGAIPMAAVLNVSTAETEVP